MSYYSVAAVFHGEVVFHRDTPLKNGIEGLVIEACSKLMKMSDEVSEMDKESYVIVEQFWDTYSEPEIELFFDISEVEDILHHEYGAEGIKETEYTAKGDYKKLKGISAEGYYFTIVNSGHGSPYAILHDKRSWNKHKNDRKLPLIRDSRDNWEAQCESCDSWTRFNDNWCMDCASDLNCCNCDADYAAESVTKTKGKVRTMSGKPHKPRKLTQDQGISPEEAAKRIALKSETDSSWSIQNIDTYDTIYGTRIDGKLYNHSTGERAEFTDAEIEPPYVVEDMWDDDEYEDDEEDDDEDVNCSCDNLDHTRSNVECPLNDEHEILSEIAISKDSEEEAYAYAYNVGHSDGRKREPYKPNPEVKDTADFRKVYKQRAENTWNPKTFESENRVFKSPLDDKTREIL